MKKFLLLAFLFSNQLFSAEVISKSDIARGRHLVRIAGCNDCHTPQFTLKGGDVPEKDWLIGDAIGWKGPWGTTYPANVRSRVSAMNEVQWISYAQEMKSRPPMPWWSLNAMSAEELKLIYRYIKSLGTSDKQIPDALAPGEMPKTPYIDMNVQFPKS